MTIRWEQQYQRKQRIRAIAARYFDVKMVCFYMMLGTFGVFVLLGSGCNKLVKIQEEKPVEQAVVNRAIKSVQSMEEMIVPKTFNWNTAQRIQMNVNILAKAGEKSSGVVIQVYYKDNVRKELREMVSGISNSSGSVGTVFNLPTYVRSVYIKTNKTGEKLFEVPVNSYSFDYTLRL